MSPKSDMHPEGSMGGGREGDLPLHWKKMLDFKVHLLFLEIVHF